MQVMSAGLRGWKGSGLGRNTYCRTLLRGSSDMACGPGGKTAVRRLA